MKHTKIVCTIGPSSNNDRTLKEMIKNGMNVARLNMSHGSYDEHLATIRRLKNLRDRLKVPLGVMIDLKGPEIRIGEFEHGYVELKKNQEFKLVNKKIIGNELEVSVSSARLFERVKPKQKLLLSDGSIELIVKETSKQGIICSVLVGGKLWSNKSINAPGLKLFDSYLSEVDKLDILFGLSEGMDFLAISFVQSENDVRAVREFLKENNGEKVQIISKVESAKGVKNLKNIIKSSDGIMIARGDLGVEVDYVKLPHIQKLMARQAVEYGKYAICATQMLESMINNSKPTRAEVTDVANAVLDGCGAVMLSGETAMGGNPALCVKVMNLIVSESEKYIENIQYVDSRNVDMCKSICDSSVESAKKLRAAAILTVTNSGLTARQISIKRPKQIIVAYTPSREVYNQMSILFGVEPFIIEKEKDIDGLLLKARTKAKEHGIVKNGDLVVQTIGIPLGEKTNAIKINII